jgi:hypothetical protein
MHSCNSASSLVAILEWTDLRLDREYLRPSRIRAFGSSPGVCSGPRRPRQSVGILHWSMLPQPIAICSSSMRSRSGSSNRPVIPPKRSISSVLGGKWRVHHLRRPHLIRSHGFRREAVRAGRAYRNTAGIQLCLSAALLAGCHKVPFQRWPLLDHPWGMRSVQNRSVVAWTKASR